MNCPFCGEPDTRVINSRPSDAGDSVRRRRECQKCGRRFTTFEYVEKVEMMVVKRGGAREPFELKKIRSGIEKACEKRPVSSDKIESMVKDVEREILNMPQQEIPSSEIGKNILKVLKGVDAVAYLRFASVYKQFRDLQDFNAEIETLMKD